MQESLNLPLTSDYLPSNEAARIAVERARRIVRENNEMILALKAQSNLLTRELNYNEFQEAENFSFEGPYSFHTTKIKSSNGIKDFILDIFGVH